MKNKKLVFALTVAATLAIGTCSFTACELPFGTQAGQSTLELSETELELVIGESTKLVATTSSGEAVTWETSDKDVATVKNGRITAIGAGEATITAICGETKVTCTVQVVAVNIVLSETSATVEKGSTLTLTATADREGNIVWSSSDESIATVENGVVTAKKEGTATITATYKNTECKATCEITVGWANKPADYEELTNGGEKDTADHLNKFVYWNDQNWCGSSVSVTTAEYGNGKATISYSGATSACWFGLQVFYKNSNNVPGKQYRASMTITSEQEGDITVCGTIVHLESGANAVEVYYTEQEFNYTGTEAAASITIQMGVESAGTVISENTVSISTPTFEEYTPQKLDAPGGFAVSPATKMLDAGEVEHADGYCLTFYKDGKLAYKVTLQQNGILDDSAMEDGEYTVKIAAIGSGMYVTSDESEFTLIWTVANGGVSYDMELQGEEYARANPGKFYYWTEWSGIANAKYENGTITLDIVNGGSWYSNQLFYKSPALTQGTTYILTFSITSTKADKITVNNRVIDLTAGTTQVSVEYTESAGASLSIQFGVNEVGCSFAEGTSITITNIQFTAK